VGHLAAEQAPAQPEARVSHHFPATVLEKDLAELDQEILAVKVIPDVAAVESERGVLVERLLEALVFEGLQLAGREGVRPDADDAGAGMVAPRH
jgi:hypothetical protein